MNDARMIKFRDYKNLEETITLIYHIEKSQHILYL